MLWDDVKRELDADSGMLWPQGDLGLYFAGRDDGLGEEQISCL